MGELETFVLKGTVMLEKGWTKYDDYTQKDKVLPNLKEGDVVNINFQPKEKETTPPKHYTIETLNNYLKNPFKEEKSAAKEADTESGEDDTADYKAIFEGLELGTEATRTGIIDNARKSGYIDLKKDVYSILPGGEFLIQSLVQMQINMDKYKTSQLGQALKKVYHGTMRVEESVRLAEEEIAAVFARDPDPVDAVIGKCPLCGGDVVRNQSFYGCANYKQNACKFSVNSFICGKMIPVAELQKLLAEGKTNLIDGFVSPRSGKSFSAMLVLKNGKAVFEFPPKSAPSGFPSQEPPMGAGGEAPPPLEPPDFFE